MTSARATLDSALALRGNCAKASHHAATLTQARRSRGERPCRRTIQVRRPNLRQGGYSARSPRRTVHAASTATAHRAYLRPHHPRCLALRALCPRRPVRRARAPHRFPRSRRSIAFRGRVAHPWCSPTSSSRRRCLRLRPRALANGRHCRARRCTSWPVHGRRPTCPRRSLPPKSAHSTGVRTPRRYGPRRGRHRARPSIRLPPGRARRPDRARPRTQAAPLPAVPACPCRPWSPI